MTSEVTTPGTNFPFQNALVLSEDPNLDTRLQQVRRLHDASKSSRALVELVDLYATLAELSGLEIPPACPQGKISIAFCTEGSSLVPVIHNVASPSPNTTLQWKSAAFTQYPRPSTSIQHNSGSPNLADIRVMGYSMRTDEQRYTEWIGYDPTTFTANWTQVYTRELYDHSADPDEDVNVADDPQFARLVAQLSLQLRDGWREALPPSPPRSQPNPGASRM